MRIAFVGGAGEMGHKAARTAATFQEVKEIRILDRDIDSAEELASELGDKAAAIHFDITSHDLVELLDGCDAVLNTLGPFTRFGTTVLSAAIAARCNYVDINDDWQPTLEALELDEAARDAGVTAIIGMGASPGVTNVVATELAARLDETREVLTGWSLAGTRPESEDAGPTAAMYHFLDQCSGTIRAMDDGQVVDVVPVRRMDVPLPDGTGLEAWTVGHPEAATLPSHFPGLQRCFNMMTGPAWYFDVVKETAGKLESGELSMGEAADILHTPQRPEGVRRAAPAPPMWAWARGVRDGKEAIVFGAMRRSAPGGMASGTAIPAAMVLRMILNRSITRAGVMTPEQVVSFPVLMESLTPLYTAPTADGDIVEISMADVTKS